VWGLLFLKGLVVGFPVGFLVNQMGTTGFLVAAVSIAPQNIAVIPVYILARSLVIIVSFTLLGDAFTREVSQPIIQLLAQYLIAFSLLIVVSFIASALEAYVASGAMESLIMSFSSSEG